MGVQGLTGILSRYAPKSVRNVSCAAFAAQTIAIDASCHLNKFIYGDEPHAHRHIYGFYQLTRFCDMNNIKPIFVFDGLRRLEAKKLEHAKRERSRRKVKHSLLFEQEQSLRLDNWAEVSDMYDQTGISKESMHAILGEMSDTIDEIEKVEEQQKAPLTDQKAISDEKQFEIESKLTQIAQELRVAIAIAEDSEKYTRTVRDLAKRERELVSDIIVHRSDSLRPALDQLRRDNQAMLQSLEKRSLRVTQRMRDECKDFLQKLGYVCFTCHDHEAEAMCANMGRLGRASAIVSEDLDTLVFGNSPLLRYFFSKNRQILSIDPIVAREELNLSRDAFVDFCILCGTDFSGTIRGIGPHRALKAIQKYGSIEALTMNLDPRYSPQDTFDYKQARKVFNNLPPIPTEDEAYVPLNTSRAEKRELLEYYDIDPTEVDKKIQNAVLNQSIINHQNWGVNPFLSNTNHLAEQNLLKL